MELMEFWKFDIILSFAIATYLAIKASIFHIKPCFTDESYVLQKLEIAFQWMDTLLYISL